MFNYYIINRSTKDFTIEASTDQATWELVLSETLPSAIDVEPCLIPIQAYSVQVHARYLRYTLINFHGTGGVALNYITWDFFKL